MHDAKHDAKRGSKQVARHDANTVARRNTNAVARHDAKRTAKHDAQTKYRKTHGARHDAKRKSYRPVFFCALLVGLLASLTILCGREDSDLFSVFRSDDAAAETDAPAPEAPSPGADAVPLSYPTLGAPPDEKLIHSTKADALETHGDLSGCESALAELEALLSNFGGKISMIAYSLDGSRSLCFNTDLRFEPQCTVKVAYVYSICRYMDSVGYDDGTQIVYRPKNEYPGSGTVQNSPFGTAFSVRDLIIRTLSISDNAAYSMLCDHFGLGIRNERMKEIGCASLVSNYMWGGGVVPADFVILWTEIFNYLRTETHFAALMKEACTDTPYSYARPENGLSYSHKSGDAFDWTDCHDVCLVWDGVPYILAIFTHANVPGTSHPTIENIAKIIHERIF